MTSINNSNNRVFVSSTVYDLIDIRSEIEALLRDSGLTPVMSDSRDDGFDSTIQSNSIETCLVNLRSCEKVILILSQRYGPSLGKNGFTDHSATHLEYLEAKRLGIPVYFYVRDQLMAEFSVWKMSKAEDKAPNNFAWVDKKQLRIFDLINERIPLSENSQNWFSVFSNSIDLKRQIKRDLKVWTDSVTFWNDVENNKIPIFFPHHKCKQIGSNLQWELKLIIKNCGIVTAKNVVMTKKSTEQPEIEIIVPPGESIKQVMLIDSSIPVDFSDEIKLEYEDLKGRRYEDLLIVTIRGAGTGIITSFTLKDRKFLDSNSQIRIKN